MTIWRFSFGLIAGLALLAACAPMTIYHRASTPVSEMETELLACEVSALAAVPVANQIRREPPRYVPGRRICDANGHCHTRGGYYLPGEIYTVDVNLSLRERAEGQCMADKGFAPATLPNCPNAVFRAAERAQTRTLPRLTPQSCVIRYGDGTWQIVDQAG